MRIIKDFINGFLHIFFPDVCLNCSEALSQQETKICYRCLSQLQPARYTNHEENEITRIFEGRIPITYATAGFIYHKEGILQHLIFLLKYHRHKDIGQILGREMGSLLQDSVFNEIDTIIPVPLHPKKQKKRGYNQAKWIAMGLSEMLNKSINTSSLLRTTHTASQTKKNRIERFENVQNIFKVMPQIDLTGKHILLVDDIITTGSTIESCANALLTHFPTLKISIACLAKAN